MNIFVKVADLQKTENHVQDTTSKSKKLPFHVVLELVKAKFSANGQQVAFQKLSVLDEQPAQQKKTLHNEQDQLLTTDFAKTQVEKLSKDDKQNQIPLKSQNESFKKVSSLPLTADLKSGIQKVDKQAVLNEKQEQPSSKPQISSFEKISSQSSPTERKLDIQKVDGQFVQQSDSLNHLEDTVQIVEDKKGNFKLIQTNQDMAVQKTPEKKEVQLTKEIAFENNLNQKDSNTFVAHLLARQEVVNSSQNQVNIKVEKNQQAKPSGEETLKSLNAFVKVQAHEQKPISEHSKLSVQGQTLLSNEHKNISDKKQENAIFEDASTNLQKNSVQNFQEFVLPVKETLNDKISSSIFDKHQNNLVSEKVQSNLQRSSKKEPDTLTSSLKNAVETSKIELTVVDQAKVVEIGSRNLQASRMVENRKEVKVTANESASTEKLTITIKQVQIVLRNLAKGVEEYKSEFSQYRNLKKKIPQNLKVSEPIKIENLKFEIARDLKKDKPTVEEKPIYSKLEQTQKTKELADAKIGKKVYENEQTIVEVRQLPRTLETIVAKVEQQQKVDNLTTIVETIRQMNNASIEKAFVDLSPPSLGRLEIQIVKQGETLNIVFKVASDEAKELLEKSSKDLLSRLSAVGFKVESIEVKTTPKFEQEQPLHDREQNQQHEQHHHQRQRKWQESEVMSDDKRDK
ncbi:flagellar hook-length control protein FliK, partial [Pseudothermotoga thermarum]|uniref:Flagellar hook-length control protein-like, C-terminal domain protein n=1 Tax=Pseudothermotoga thermarum DSM 5069 TaxID=688269 RepID=F7YW64_9THEM